MTDNLKADAIAVFTQLIQDIGNMDSRQKVLDQILSTVLKLSGAQRACLFMNTENSGSSLHMAVAGGLPADRNSYQTIQKIAALTLKKRKIFRAEDAILEEDLKSYRYTILSIGPFYCIPVSFRKHITAMLYLDNNNSAFSLPDEILSVINALIIQAVTEITLHPGIPGREDNIDPERFDNICKSIKITNKEKQVLMFLLKGYTKKQIAEEQSISINTVKHHISNIYDKTGASSRKELMDIFILRNNPDN